MKKIGITGANGHVGTNLVRRLLNENFEIRVLQYHDHEALDGLEIEVMKGDLNDPASLSVFCEGVDVLFHLAAKISIGNNSFDNLHSINVEGTQNLVNAAKNAGIKRYIHFSSIHALVHEPLDQPMDESRPLVAESKMPYEHTKAIAEEWVLNQQENDFDVIVINPTSILGPLDFKPSLMGQLMIRLYNGSLPGLVPGGYNWVDVRDVADAACNAIYQGNGGERYILSGTYKTVVDFAKLFATVNDQRVNTRVLPLWLARIGVPFISIYSKLTGQDPLYTSKSLDILQEGNRNIICDKAKKELGFNPRPLAQTLKDSADWFKEIGKIN